MTRALEDTEMALPDRPVAGEPVRVEPVAKRVRVFFAGAVVADSTRPLLLLERRHLAVYYFPQEDVRMDLLTPTDEKTHSPGKGEASYWTVKVGEKEAVNAAWSYLDPVAGRDDIRGYVAFYWHKMQAWFEEDDEVFVHPRDPYHRIDVLNSSRHVRVVVGGQVVAETRRPRLLFETSLPTRYYIPKLDVRMDLLEPSTTRTQCPYKGTASYWSVRSDDAVEKDLAWSYPTPLPEVNKIENLVCFFNEVVDTFVDGELQPKPITPWSRRK
jgi:uncharacterized protein (DUF427 family)